MSLWRTDQFDRPGGDSARALGLVVSLVLHLLFFLVVWCVGLINFEPKETVIPIDLTVIVNENLDGVENEPPPLLNPPPPPPPKPPARVTPPKPKKQDPPKALEQIFTNVVTKVDKVADKKPEEKKKDEKKDPPKKDPPKPEPPKKTKKELEEERLKRMRDRAVKNTKPVKIEVPNATQSGNGRTKQQPLSPAEIARLLGAGARPGTSNQLAASDLQFGVSRIQMSLDDKWAKLSPKVGRDGTVILSCRLNSSGGLVGVRISKSCGDPLSDQAALTVARSLNAIVGLPESFKARFMKEEISIRYQVSGR